MGAPRGRRGTGGVMAAIIIVLLLLLAVGFYYWQQGYQSRVARLESIESTRRAMEEEARLLVHMGVVGNATGDNISIALYNGAPFPLTLTALVLATTGGEVDVVNATHKPPFLVEASAYLYRLTGQGLILVKEYQDLQQAIASGLTVPRSYILVINVTATQPLDGLRTHAAFKAPLTGAGVTAAIPITVAATAVYTSPAQAATGGGGGAPPTTTTTTTATTTATVPPGACYIEVRVQNNAEVDLTNYPVRIRLDTSNVNQTIWQQLDETKIYVTEVVDGVEVPTYYYIEYFNKAEEAALIWALINATAGSTVTLRIYYNYTGGNPYTDYNNPYKIFTYYNPGDATLFEWYPYDRFDETNYDDIGTINGSNASAWRTSPLDSGTAINNTVGEGEVFYEYKYVYEFALKGLPSSSSGYGYCVSTLATLYGIESAQFGFEAPESVGVVLLRPTGGGNAEYLTAYIYYDPYSASSYIPTVPSIHPYIQGFRMLQVSGGTNNTLNDRKWAFDVNGWYRLVLCVTPSSGGYIVEWRAEEPSGAVVLDDNGAQIVGNATVDLGDLPSYAGLSGGLAAYFIILYVGPSHLYDYVYVTPHVYPEPTVAVEGAYCTG